MGIHGDDLGLDLLTSLEQQLGILDPLLADLGYVNETVHTLLELHEQPEVHDLDDLHVQHLAHRVVHGNASPRIVHGLLDAEADLRFVLIELDVEHDGVHLVALLIELGGMAHAVRPTQVGDMHEAVDAVLNLHEHAKVGDVADAAVNRRAHGILLPQSVVGVRLELLHAEADAVVAGVDVQHHRLEGVAHGDHLGRMLHPTGPAHLGDVDEALDAVLQLHERAVVLEADHLALDHRAGHVAVLGLGPGILGDLLEAEAYALGLRIVLEHHHADLVAHLEQLGRVTHPAPGHIRDVQKAIDAAQVDEGAVLGEVLNDALNDLAFLKLLEGVGLEVGPLPLEQHPATEHDVTTLLVELDDLELKELPDESVQVPYGAQVHLAARKEGLDATPDTHREAALHPLGDGAFNELIALTGSADLVPDLEAVSLLLGEDDQAVLVLAADQQDIDRIAGSDGCLTVSAHEFMNRDLAL